MPSDHQPSTTNHQPFVWLLLLAFWALLYLPGVGSSEIRGEEWRRVLPARAMLQTGDWLVPFSGGQPYLRKPPLINWTTALSFKLTGEQTEWTARLPSLLLMLGATLGVFAFSRRFMGQQAALLGTLFFISSIGVMEKGRIAELEVYYITFTALAFVAWLAAFLGKFNRWAGWLWAGLFLGLAFLAKGPVHLLFFYAIVLGVCWKTRRWTELWSGPHIAGFLLFLAMILAWGIPFIAAYSRVMNVPVSEVLSFWQNEIASRASGEARSELDDFLLRGPKALVMFLPWVLFVPLLWKKSSYASTSIDNQHKLTIMGAWFGVAASFLLMILLPASSARYVAPLLGPAALLSGWMIGPALAGTVKPFLVWQWIITFLGVALLLGAGYLAWRTGDMLAWGIIVGSTLVLGILWKALARPSGSHSLVPLTMLTAVLCGLGIAGVVVVERNKLAGTDRIRPLSLEIRDAVQPKDGPAYVFRVGQVPYPFYLGEDTVELQLLSQLPPSGVKWMLTTSAVAKEILSDLESRFGKVESSREFARTWGSSQRGQKLVLLRFAGTGPSHAAPVSLPPAP